MAEANYLFEVADKFTAGPAVSYQYSFGKTYTEEFGGFEVEVEIEGSGDLTLGGSARYELTEQFVVGADLGFYLNASTLYYRPLVGYKINESTMVQLSLPSNKYTTSIAVGVMFGL